MSKTTAFEFPINSAYGVELKDMGKEPLSVSTSYIHAETVADLDSDERNPSEKSLLQYANAARKAAARAKATTEALNKAGIEKPTAKDDNVAIREMVKMIKLREPNVAEDVAINRAKMALGL